MEMVLLQDRQIAVDLLGESVIAENGWYIDAVRRLEGGRLVARGQYCESKGGEVVRGNWWRTSTDDGRSWQPYDVIEGEADYTRAAVPFLSQRVDGSVIGWSSSWREAAAYEGRPGQPTEHTVVRAPSWEALARGEAETLPSTVSIPYMTPLVGDDLKTSYTPAIWGKMVETEDGHLIQGAYPVLAYDRAPRLWAEQKGPAPQYRTCVIYSRDDGATWHYLSTVASSDWHPLPAQAEGYCEPDLLYLGDGRLLCVMRSGGSPTGRLMERYASLVACRSDDGGLTWTAPKPIAPYGVKPILLRMSGGLIACLAGRPGFFVLFSADEGQSWSTPLWVNESHGPWRRSASGYGELIELEPSVLGVAYDGYEGNGEKGTMVAKLRRYSVGR